METTSSQTTAGKKKKNSVSETGHVINVANFENLISFCKAYGQAYNPSKKSVTMAGLKAIYSEAIKSTEKVTSAKNALDNAIGMRQLAFDPLRAYATRIINALNATDAPKATISHARSINLKLQGRRAAKTVTVNGEDETKTTDTKTISSSQQSYNRQADFFKSLIDLMSSEPAYTPNETELQVDALKAKLSELQGANTTVVNKYTEYSNAMVYRNQVMYTNDNNLVDAALDTKKYVKSVFGATSAQYKQISGLKFTRRS